MRTLKQLLAVLLAISGSSIAFAQMNMGSRNNVPEEHVVRDGDTLWSICESYFGDPWQWPTVWALNPHITNPHWIYPDDVIRLKRVNAPATPEAKPARYTASVQDASLASLNEGFIVEKQMDEVGKIAGSFLPRQYLALHDDVYVEFKDLDKVNVGDRFTIYHTVGDVTHPDSGDVLGQKILIMGLLEVTGKEKKVARGQIIGSNREIERGMKLTKLLDDQLSVSPKENLVEIEGVVVEALHEIEEMGQYHIVLLDRGSKDGVQVGNRFFVRRRGDGFAESDDDSRFPWEQIGEVMVVQIQDHNSTAIVTRSELEIHRGDSIVMQRNY